MGLNRRTERLCWIGSVICLSLLFVFKPSTTITHNTLPASAVQTDVAPPECPVCPDRSGDEGGHDIVVAGAQLGDDDDDNRDKRAVPSMHDDEGDLDTDADGKFVPLEHRAYMNITVTHKSAAERATYLKECMDRYELVFEHQRLWHNLKWLGVRFQQNPNDAIVIQMLLNKINPDLIIETGSAFGGSSLYFATIMDRIRPNEHFHIVSVDVRTQLGHATRALNNMGLRDKITYIKGSSVHPKVIEQIQTFVSNSTYKTVFISLDSDHHAEHVYEELQLYSKWVTPGSFVIVQDTRLSLHSLYCWKKSFKGPCDGPLEAVHEFLDTEWGGANFRQAREMEFMHFSNHKEGYLERKGAKKKRGRRGPKRKLLASDLALETEDERRLARVFGDDDDM